MRICVHARTETENHVQFEALIAETHTHMETLCMLGRGLVAGNLGVLPADYSIWVDGACVQAHGRHRPLINSKEAEVDWGAALPE